MGDITAMDRPAAPKVKQPLQRPSKEHRETWAKIDWHSAKTVIAPKPKAKPA
jgi:hypothetical protein